MQRGTDLTLLCVHVGRGEVKLTLPPVPATVLAPLARKSMKKGGNLATVPLMFADTIYTAEARRSHTRNYYYRFTFESLSIQQY